MTILTKNTDKLREEVAAHVAADSITQGVYWDNKTKRGCFIGCLAKRDDPSINEVTYGLPVMLQRIAENIFEALPTDDAKAFFAALPDAVACDGKDLTKVSWQFLAAELRSLPEQPAEIQSVIDPVIAGMDLLASGQEWTAVNARAAATAAAAADAAPDVASAAALNAAAWAAEAAADSTPVATPVTAQNAAAWSAAWAAEAAADSTPVATPVTAQNAAAWAAARVRAAARDAAHAVALLRQRDLLLRLISEAPVVEDHQ